MPIKIPLRIIAKKKKISGKLLLKNIKIILGNLNSFTDYFLTFYHAPFTPKKLISNFTCWQDCLSSHASSIKKKNILTKSQHKTQIFHSPNENTLEMKTHLLRCCFGKLVELSGLISAPWSAMREARCLRRCVSIMTSVKPPQTFSMTWEEWWLTYRWRWYNQKLQILFNKD